MAALGGLILLISLSACRMKKNYPAQDATAFDVSYYDSSVYERPEYLYGFNTDSFRFSGGVVRRNENLASIFNDLNISYETLQKIIDSADNVFDFRKVKRGNHYMVFHELDSTDAARYFIYVADPVHFFVFDLGDSAKVEKKQKKINSEFRTASGEIEYSLWQTIVDENLNPDLALQLSEIYAWSIDFFGLQKGDSFRIIYEEQYVDSTSVGISRILAARFCHAGEVFFAMPFNQDGTEDYFDEEGNSLRKAFLKAPLRFSRISSRFSNSRMHPILKYRRPHHGVDYAAPMGTPVHAIGDGKVTFAGWKGGAGRLVKIKHNSSYTTAYMHLAGFGKGIKAGKYVKQGDIIAYVGNSGLSTGPHLDFRFYKNGTPIDPLRVKAPPVHPVDSNNMAMYNKVAGVLMELLETVGSSCEDSEKLALFKQDKTNLLQP